MGIFEIAFPDRVRGYYLIGSYSDGSAVPGSDIDLIILFKGKREAGEHERFRALVKSCTRFTSIRLDINSAAEETFLIQASAGVKAALVVYGEDVRDPIPLEPVERSTRRAMRNAFHSMYLLRKRAANLIYPLDYPNSNGEFYGYDEWGTYLGGREFAPGVRTLVTTVSLIATTIIGLKAGEQSGSKRQSVDFYREYVGDEWTTFIEDVYQTCKMEWQYQSPNSASERERFHTLCEQMLAFENHFLSPCRSYVLDDLQHENVDVKLLALERLKRIAYTGNDFVSTLMLLSHDKELYEHVHAILLKIETGKEF